MASDKLKGTLGYLFTVFKKDSQFLTDFGGNFFIIRVVLGSHRILESTQFGWPYFSASYLCPADFVFCYNGVLFNTQWLHQNIRCSDTLFSNLTQKSISCFMFALEFPKSITLSQLKKISWIKHLENFVLKCPEFVTECSQRKMDSSQNCFVSILVQYDLQLTHYEH